MNPTNVAVPPHSLDAERAVLGGLLLSDRNMPAVRLDERLTPEDFFREQHAWVFEAMCALHDVDRPIDVVTVAQAMRDMGSRNDLVFGEEMLGFIDELAGWVPAAGHVREYARIVREHALRRRLLTASYEIQMDVQVGDQPVRDLIEHAERRMLSIADTVASDLAVINPDDEMARLESIREGREIVGTPTGFVDLDRLMGGLQDSNLIVLAARPSMGKSALAVNFAENLAAQGTAVALFSLEMSRGELLRRVLASRARVSGDTLLRGPIPPNQWERIEDAVEEIAKWPLYVDDGSDAGVLDIRAKARRLAQRVDLGMVVVDYLQLMRAEANAENRNAEIGKITRGMKLLAKELAVPVVLLSQLSRAVEHRMDKRPQLSDLRDSGTVEQDADVVMFLYRDSYYNDDVEEPDMTELRVAKQRNGPLGTVKLLFQSSYPKFASYASEPAAAPSGGTPRTNAGEAMMF